MSVNQGCHCFYCRVFSSRLVQVTDRKVLKAQVGAPGVFKCPFVEKSFRAFFGILQSFCFWSFLNLSLDAYEGIRYKVIVKRELQHFQVCL